MYINRLRSHCRHTRQVSTVQPLAAAVPSKPNDITSNGTVAAPSQAIPPQPVRPRQVGCFRCYQSGHVAARCTAAVPANGQTRCKQCGDSRHQASTCPKQKVQLLCSRCSRQGHLASICFGNLLGQNGPSQKVTAPSSTTTATAREVQQNKVEDNPMPEEPTFTSTRSAATMATLCSLTTEDVVTSEGQGNGEDWQDRVCRTAATTTTCSEEEEFVIKKLTDARLPETSNAAVAPQQGPLYTELMLVSTQASSLPSGRQYKTMIDTGSGYSFVNDKTLSQLLQHGLVHSYRKAASLKVITAGGSIFYCRVQIKLIIKTKAGLVPIWVYAAKDLHNSFILGVDVLLQLQSVIVMDDAGVRIHTHCRDKFSSLGHLLTNGGRATKSLGSTKEITLGPQETSFPSTQDDLPELVEKVRIGAAVTTSTASQGPIRRGRDFDVIDEHTLRYTASLLASNGTVDDSNSVLETPAELTTTSDSTDVWQGTHTLRFEKTRDHAGKVYIKHVHRLPWKSSARPKNDIEKIRRQTVARLSKMNAQDYREYADCLRTLSQAGVIKKFDEGQEPLYAMVHFGVRPAYTAPTVTTPLRPVWVGTGLSGYLDPPVGHLKINVAKPLTLIRCHEHYHVEDLSKAFYSLHLEKEDFGYLAFWWDGGWWHFVRCPMGVPSSPAQLSFSVENILDDLQNTTYDTKVPTVPHVDDIAQGFTSKCDRDRVHSQNVEGFSNNGFKVNEVKRVTDEDRNVRVLGVWINDKDEMMLLTVPPLVSKVGKVTMLDAVRYASSCFDPLGLAAETTTLQRLLIRECHTLGLDKQDAVPDHILKKLLCCRRSLLDMQPLQRYVRPYVHEGHPVYFCFVDASAEAISLVISARGGDRVYASGALVPKSRQLWTVVRLELAAIQTALSYIDLFCDSLRDTPKAPIIVIATDSDINVARVNSDRPPSRSLCKWDQSAITRLRDQLRQRGYLLRHIPGCANPADSVSRPSTHMVRSRGQPPPYDPEILEAWIQETLESLGYNKVHQTTSKPSSQERSQAQLHAICAAVTRRMTKAQASFPLQFAYTLDEVKDLQRKDDHLRAIIASLQHPQQPLAIRAQLRYYYLDGDQVLRHKVHEEDGGAAQKEVDEDTLFGKTADPIVLPSRAAKPLWSRAHNLMCLVLGHATDDCQDMSYGIE